MHYCNICGNLFLQTVVEVISGVFQTASMAENREVVMHFIHSFTNSGFSTGFRRRERENAMRVRSLTWGRPDGTIDEVRCLCGHGKQPGGRILGQGTGSQGGGSYQGDYTCHPDAKLSRSHLSTRSTVAVGTCYTSGCWNVGVELVLSRATNRQQCSKRSSFRGGQLVLRRVPLNVS